jgi:16S rRNA (guanine527-N7)-methyltransferase
VETEAALLPDGSAAAAELAGLASELGLTLDTTQCDRLLRFADLLRRWNRIHNLTAIERPEQIVSHHLLDSLALAPTLDELAGGRTLRVLDVGAGGGLPGIPLATALPGHHFTLLDKVGKKVAFLMQAKLELGLANVDVVHTRVEDYDAPPFDVIVARAFSSLADFIRVTQRLLAPRGTWCAMKGAVPRAEMAQLEEARLGVHLTRTVKLHVPRLDAERHVLLIEPN